ncbi:MAG: protealysin inhibitor emfourin [Planctomycetota bacterium]
MKIRFRQSGGFAGLAKVAEVDSEQVPGDEVDRLRTMVEQALAEAAGDSTPALPDEEQYCVEIEIHERRETLLVARSSVPGPVRPLIEYLEKLAEYEKR